MINSVDQQLGVLLRQTQWLLDDAAHHIPAGRYQPGERDELALVLEQVASLIRATKPIIIHPHGAPAAALENQYPATNDLPIQRAKTAYPSHPFPVSDQP